MCSLFSMTNTSARPPRFPSVLYDLGRLVCTNQMSCRCSGPLGRVASHLPTPCFADPADSRPACLSPISLPAVSHLQVLSGCFGPHGSALASHMSTNVSQYAVDALTLAPHLSPPASARVLWAFWAAPFYTYVPLVSHLPPTVSEYAVGALHFSRTVSTDTLDVLCRMNLHLSPPCLLLSPNKSWVLWAAGSYTCFPLVFYCLTVRCSVGALGYFLFSFVSCLSPCMPCCAISEAVYSRVRWCVIGVVGAAFQLFPCVSHLLHKSVPVILLFGTADFTLLLLVSHLSTASFPVCGGIGTEYFLYCIAYLSLICRLLLSLCCPYSEKHDLSTAEPHLSPTSVSVLRPLVSCLPSNFFDYFLSYLYMVSWQAPIRRLMFPSSVWARMEWMVPSSFCACMSPLLCLLLLIYALPSLMISLNLYPCVVAPHQHRIFATWAEKMVLISCNATRIDLYVASLERPRKNFLVRSLSLKTFHLQRVFGC